MNAEELEARVKSLDGRLKMIEDVEEIESLQRKYAYYLDYGMWEEFAGLFSDNAESIEIAGFGVYLGKAGIERVCKFMGANRVPRVDSSRGELDAMVVPRTLFHAMTIGQAVVHIAPGGNIAYGRWSLLELASRPMDGTWRQYWGGGPYENEYIKEGGRWRFKKLYFHLAFKTPYHENGWDGTQLIFDSRHPTIKPDRPSTNYHPYPEFATVPFHFRRPVAGQ
jgi:hypothetical protein